MSSSLEIPVTAIYKEPKIETLTTNLALIREVNSHRRKLIARL
jgi:hypothetical protein